MLHRVIVPALLRIALLSILVGALPPAPMPIALAKPAIVGPPAPALVAAQPAPARVLHSPTPPPDFVPPPLRPRAPQPPPPHVPPSHPTGPRIFQSKPGSTAEAAHTESRRIGIQSAATGNITNAYIKTLISAGGRFVTGTTGGDPTTPNDDNKKLLYGFPSNVGSSFSTLRVSTGSTTNDYRLGSTDWDNIGIAPTTGPTSDGSAITTVWERDGVRVKERLTLAPDPASGNRNMTAIAYTVTNTNAANRIVGMRVMLDVEVGNNDRAPYIVPDAGQVVNQREWLGAQVPSYWIAYESATFAFQVASRYRKYISGASGTSLLLQTSMQDACI